MLCKYWVVLFSVPDVALVGVGEIEDGGGRRHATAMQEARAEVELSEAEVEAGQHTDACHLNGGTPVSSRVVTPLSGTSRTDSPHNHKRQQHYHGNRSYMGFIHYCARLP